MIFEPWGGVNGDGKDKNRWKPAYSLLIDEGLEEAGSRSVP